MPHPFNDSTEASFRELFDTYKNRLYGYIHAITHSPHSAEELTQEVFIKLWLCRDDLVNVINLDAFIFKIARNKTLNYLRKASYDEKLLRELQSHMITAENTAEQRLNMAEYQKLLAGAVNNLSPQRKMVYELSRQEGFTLEQIAERMDLSPNTTRNHLAEALKQIREHFIKNGSGTIALVYFLIS